MERQFTLQSTEAILKRIEERSESDMLGFEWHEYLVALDFESAKVYLKPDASPDGWETPTAQTIYDRMADYIGFAFEKAYGERGISANRSIMHFIAWTWLIDPEFSIEIEQMYEDDYREYGLPILRHICKHYGWDILSI